MVDKKNGEMGGVVFPGVEFPVVQFKWVSPEGKACVHLKCMCGEEVEKVIDLREVTIISCPKCKMPVFRGEPAK